LADNPRIQYTIKIKGKAMRGELSLGEFMDVKGWKAMGNRLSDQLLSAVKEVPAGEQPPEPTTDPQQGDLFGQGGAETKQTFKPGDTVEFD